MKKETISSIASKIKDLTKQADILGHSRIIVNSPNYYDYSGVPQPQEDYVYDYYIDRGIVPPWFEEYRHKQQQYEDAGLTRVKDETAYFIRKYFREHGNYDGCTYNYNRTF